MIIVDDRDPIGELPPPFPPRNIQVKEDVDMRKFYDLKREIGRGRFGTVYLAEDKATGQKFAAKFVNTKRNQDRANAVREVAIMKSLNSESPHPRLIQLYDAYDMTKEMCLVLEIVDGGELFERVIDDDFVLSERACTVFIRQICEGVEFIHSKNILHLDMKPENILCLSREGNRIKICDFGLARRYDPRKKLQVLFGTPEFVAPEVVNFEPISFGTDMWSVGVICYVLLSGLSPFMGHNYVETMTNVTRNKYDFEDEAFLSVSEDAKDFIQKLLVLDKSLRLTPAQCLRHDWLRKPPISTLRRRCLEFESESESESESDVSITEEKIAKEKKENEKERKRKEDELIKQVEAKRKELEKQMEEKTKELEKQMEEKKRELEKQMEENKRELEKKAEAIKREEELERTKAQLKEFVERWNSHPNSPYLVGTPIPIDLQRLVKTGGWNSRASFASVAVAPPSEADLSRMEEDVFCFNDLDDATNHEALINDIGGQEEFTMYTIEPPGPLAKQPSPEEVAKELEAKLTRLQLEDRAVPSNDTCTVTGHPHHSATHTAQSKAHHCKDGTNETVRRQNEKPESTKITAIKTKDKINIYNEEQAKEKEILNKKKEEQMRTNEILANKEKDSQRKGIEAHNKMGEDQIEKHKKAYEERKRMKNTHPDQNKENKETSSSSNQDQDQKEKSNVIERKASRGSRPIVSEEPMEAEKIINDILKVDHKSAYEEYKKMMSEAQVKKEEQLKENERMEVPEQLPDQTQKMTTKKRDDAHKRENKEHKITSNSMNTKWEEQRKNEVEKADDTGRRKTSQESATYKQNSDNKRVNGVKKETNEEKQSEEERKKRQEAELAEHKRLYEEYKKMVEQGQNKKEEKIVAKVSQARDEQRVSGGEAVSGAWSNTTQLNKELHRKPETRTMNTCSKPDQLPKEPLKRPEIIALQNEELGGVIPRQRKKSLSRLEQSGETKSSEEREHSPRGSRGSTPTKQLKKQPSRDVPLQAKNLEKEDHGETPVIHVSLRVGTLPSVTNDNDSLYGGERQNSVPGSPTRVSRRTSHEERPLSRESDRGTRGGTPVSSSHRRPSRDVPLSHAQIERLAAASGVCISDPSLPQAQAWPDIIVGPQGEDTEDLPDYKDSLDVPVATLMKSPSGTLLSVPGVTVSQAERQVMNTSSSPYPNHETQDDTVTKDEEAYVPNNKLVAWILDIGTKVQHTPSVSTTDRVNQWESRDSSPRLTPSPSRDRSPRPRDISPQPRDRSPLPTGKMRDKSPSLAKPQPPFEPLAREASSDNLCIQTPWGTLKRSPSKINLSKSPSFEAPSTKVGEMATNGLSSTEFSSEKSDGSTSSTRSLSPRTSISRLQRQSAVEATDATNSHPSLRVSGKIPPKPPEINKETYTAEKEDNGRKTVGKQDDYKSHTLPRTSKLMKQRSSDTLNLYSSDRKRDVKKPPPIDIKKIEEESNSTSLKRKSKFPPSPNQKKKIGPMLFSAQDRIFQFEQKPSTDRPPQRPLTRTRSNVVLALCSEKVTNDNNKNSFRGSQVSDKTQVGFMRTRLLDKVGRGTATLLEEPAQGEEPVSKITADNRRNSAGTTRPSLLR